MAADYTDIVWHRRMFWIEILGLTGTIYSTVAFAANGSWFGAMISGVVTLGLANHAVRNWVGWHS